MNQEETILNTNAAGDWMHEAIPSQTPAQWRTALINNRRTDRSTPYRVPFLTMGKAAFYKLDDLKEFVEFEKSRRIGAFKVSAKTAEAFRAVGFNEKGGSSTGRKFDVQNISRQINEATGEVFVQLHINNPLYVFRLSPDEAREYAEMLLEAAGSRKSAVVYETVRDDDTALIQRSAG